MTTHQRPIEEIIGEVRASIATHLEVARRISMRVERERILDRVGELEDRLRRLYEQQGIGEPPPT